MGRTSGNCQAEGQRTTSAAAADLVTIYKVGANSGQYEPRDITISNLMSGITGDETITSGNLVIATAGKGIQIKPGSNARIGSSTLVAGTVTIANTSVTANSQIFAFRKSKGSSTALGLLSCGTITASTSFILQALKPADGTVETGDVSVVFWIIFESA